MVVGGFIPPIGIKNIGIHYYIGFCRKDVVYPFFAVDIVGPFIKGALIRIGIDLFKGVQKRIGVVKDLGKK